MSLEQLQQLLQSAEPAALLVEPRILRRVIRLDRRLQGFRFLVPHHDSYTIDRDRLLAFVDLGELGGSPSSDLPRRVILLPMPEDEELEDAGRASALLKRYSRLLLHGCVHLDLEALIARHPFPDVWVAERRDQIGRVEIAEIQEVLLKDDHLFQPPHDLETYIEFAAVYLELKYFAPHQLKIYFPAIRDWEEIDRIVNQDLNGGDLFERVRLDDRAGKLSGQLSNLPTPQEQPLQKKPSARLSLPRFRQLHARAERTAAIGNVIKAALICLRAARKAPVGYEAEAQTAVQKQLTRFSLRLQRVLELSDDEAVQWQAALEPLLAPAAVGFWSNEARLLYDLQKVCIEQERGVYRMDLVKWILSQGQRPLRRPLPLMKDALTLKHLRSIRGRLAIANISPAQREQLTSLLDELVPRVEERSRDRIRGILLKIFDEADLPPRNVPEQVARRKLIEELLDRIVERSFFNMGDLRDAFSKNDLKLPDVTTVSELVFGDALLRVDQRLDLALDGIYRRGAIYQRWPQKLSSLVFGTNFGRFLTQHLFIPFGGAYLTIEFVLHLVHALTDWFSDDPPHPTPQTDQVSEVGRAPPGSLFAASVLLLGIWLSLLIHRPAFRAWNLAVLRQSWRFIRGVFVDLPAVVLRSELVQWVLNSRTFAVVRTYLLEPCLIAFAIQLGALIYGRGFQVAELREIFLLVALFWNSPIGRYTSELTTDVLMRTWHELKIHVIYAAVQWIVEIYDGLLTGLERAVYAVDEWMRFRAGDNLPMQSLKLAGGVVWFFVSYVVVFAFTLLIEPQINPIKHFPVVTVSHKLILPTAPILRDKLAALRFRSDKPYFTKAEATTLVWTTIWLIPGIFGFLVWELKENWRLYDANRPRTLVPRAIGDHGETMSLLLHPGFHSGTLPKAFAALRREARKVGEENETRIHRKWAKIEHVGVAVSHFVEREFLNLLEEAGFLPGMELEVGAVHAATNRIEVELVNLDQPETPSRLVWEDHSGNLLGTVHAGWIDQLSVDDYHTLTTALAGLFQRAGVDKMEGRVPIVVAPPIPWEEWVAIWSPRVRERVVVEQV